MDRLAQPRSPRRRARAGLFALAAAGTLAACAGPTPRYAIREPGQGGPAPQASAPQGSGQHGTDRPYEIHGRWYYPKAQPDYDEVGMASWYGAEQAGRTADGERFDPYGLSAAHKTLPLPSVVEVTNLANGRRVRVRLNDRGPFVDGRLIDLSRGAAEKLGFDRQGVARVRVRYISPAPPLGAEGVMQAQLTPRRAVIAPPAAEPELSAAPEADAPAAVEADYRVEVGAYPSREDARQAAAQLGDGVRYMIEPTERQGATLYRVVLGGFLDEDDALAAQLRFNEAGFTAARVLKPF